MPKCKYCHGRGQTKIYDYIEAHGIGAHHCLGVEPCSECGGRGYSPFWTPAERAGLKAMGQEFKVSGNGWINVYDTIRAFVKAARAAKEPRWKRRLGRGRA